MAAKWLQLQLLSATHPLFLSPRCTAVDAHNDHNILAQKIENCYFQAFGRCMLDDVCMAPMSPFHKEVVYELVSGEAKGAGA